MSLWGCPNCGLVHTSIPGICDNCGSTCDIISKIESKPICFLCSNSENLDEDKIYIKDNEYTFNKVEHFIPIKICRNCAMDIFNNLVKSSTTGAMVSLGIGKAIEETTICVLCGKEKTKDCEEKFYENIPIFLEKIEEKHSWDFCKTCYDKICHKTNKREILTNFGV